MKNFSIKHNLEELLSEVAHKYDIAQYRIKGSFHDATPARTEFVTQAYFKGYTTGQIAQVLNLKPSSVSSIRYRSTK